MAKIDLISREIPMSAPTVNETPEMKLPSHSDPRGSSRTTPTIRPAKIGSISGPPYSGLFQIPSRAAVETPTNSHLLLIQRHNRVDLRHHLGDAFLHYFSPTPEIGTFRDIINATNHTLPPHFSPKRPRRKRPLPSSSPRDTSPPIPHNTGGGVSPPPVDAWRR